MGSSELELFRKLFFSVWEKFVLLLSPRNCFFPDFVVGVGNEVLPYLREGVGDPRVGLRGRRERRDLHVEVVVQVGVLGLARVAQFLLLNDV